MKKVLLTLLVLVVVVAVLAAAGFAGYRFGYRQGVQAASNGDTTILPFARGHEFNWEQMPMHRFGNGLDRGFHPGMGHHGFMIMHGRGFGFFSPIRLLVQLAILGFLIWFAYKLLTGWRLSLTRPATVETPRIEPTPPVESESKKDASTE